MNQKEKIERIKEFRLIDDVFFEVFASDIPACQEILRTILEDEKLIVNDIIVQSSERNLYGRSVRLDALCTLGDGFLCNKRFNAQIMIIILNGQGLMRQVLPLKNLNREQILKMSKMCILYIYLRKIFSKQGLPLIILIRLFVKMV